MLEASPVCRPIAEHHQTIRIGIWQRRQQDRVHDAEDRGGDTNPERERQKSGDREAGRPPQHPRAEPDVVRDGFEPRQARHDGLIGRPAHPQGWAGPLRLGLGAAEPPRAQRPARATAILAQVSLSVTVRLNTGCAGRRVADRRRSSRAARTGSACPARRAGERSARPCTPRALRATSG